MNPNLFKNLTEDQKVNLKFAQNLLVSRAIYAGARAVLVHAIGRKIAPKVFTSFGRTYTLCFLLRLATARPSLSEDAKARVLAVQKMVDERDNNNAL